MAGLIKPHQAVFDKIKDDEKLKICLVRVQDLILMKF